MKIAIAQINPIIGAFQRNSAKILSFISQAKNKNAELVVFPELSLVGYPPLDLLEKEHFVNDNLIALKVLASQVKNMSAIIGYVDKNPSIGKKFFNAAAFISNGKIVSRNFKVLLPSYDVFDEVRHFEPGKKIGVVSTRSAKIALTICEDIWNDKDFWRKPLYSNDPLSILKKQKVSCLINISSSPFAIGKQKIRTDMVKAISKKYKTPSIYVNQVGGNDELIFDGASFAVDEKGKIIVQCKDFEEDMVILNHPSSQEKELHPISSTDIEAIYKALTLGIKDYVSKCGFKKVLIGLSGGIDSALTATLACDALGPENVIGILMPSRYSSEGSIEDSKSLAQNLNIKTETLPIHNIFDSYLSSLKPIFQSENSSAAEENLQARIRGTLLMAISNQRGALLLTTGNKSELGTGYCTLYGDMSGGLAVLSDVPKTTVYELSKYINRNKIRIPESSITKAPSAELRPNQTDQDTLPPYETLDQILKTYIEDHKPISQIIKKGFDAQLVKDLIHRIDRNEYKRRQAPPGLRISPKAFGIGRRLPIAQGYEEKV